MTESTWTEGIKKKSYPLLEKSEVTDVVIVGGGLAGLLSAYILSEQGKKVVLIEKGSIGDGATSVTTAFLTASIDTDYTDMVRTFGLRKTKIIHHTHQKAIDFIEEIVNNHAIKCEFSRTSNFIYANTDKDITLLKEEYAILKQIDVPSQLVLEKNELGFPNSGYIEIFDQGKFHPLKFMYGLLEILEERGVLIFEHTEARNIYGNDNFAVVETPKAVICGQWAIVTTYEPFNKPLQLYFKKAFYTTYVFELEISNQLIKEGIYEDMENPYHYMRVDKVGKKMWVIIGGEDHRSDIPVNAQKSFNALKSYVEEIIYPENYTITKEWTGPILEPIDGLAYIGSFKQKNVLYAFGFSGNGMTYSGISAIIFGEIISGERNIVHDIYEPARIPDLKTLFIKGRDYSEELIKGAVLNSIKQRKTEKKKGK